MMLPSTRMFRLQVVGLATVLMTVISPALSQGLVSVSARVVCVGNPHVVLNDMDFVASGAGQVSPGVSTFHFVGANQNTLSNESSVSWRFADVLLDKTDGLVLDRGSTGNDVVVAGDFQFVDGVVDGVTHDVTLAFGDAGTASGASSQSYVNGKVSKSGNQDFVFPIGSDTSYQALEIFDVGSATYIAQYFEDIHPNYPGPHPYYDGSLSVVSTCDYWSFHRIAGSGHTKIGLTYGPDLCNWVAEPNQLFIARYNGLSWDEPISEGSGSGSAMSPASGVLPSTGSILEYGDFALVSSNADQNVLPIELLGFTAFPVEGGLVRTEWSTASEMNNDYFTVERSRDAEHFEAIGDVEGAGNSTSTRHYAFVDDAPHPGLSYYRLRQTDFDGTSIVTSPVSVFIDEGSEFVIEAAYRCGDELCLRYRSIAPYLTLEIFDPAGRLVFAEVVENADGRVRIPLDLARAIYFVKLADRRESDVAKVLY